VKGDCIGATVAKCIVLPSLFTGRLRYKIQNYQDAMAICRWYVNPHLFVTFTANPKRPKVQCMLNHIQDQRPEDRPNTVTRCFKLKLDQLMKVHTTAATLEEQGQVTIFIINNCCF